MVRETFFYVPAAWHGNILTIWDRSCCNWSVSIIILTLFRQPEAAAACHTTGPSHLLESSPMTANFTPNLCTHTHTLTHSHESDRWQSLYARSSTGQSSEHIISIKRCVHLWQTAALFTHQWTVSVLQSLPGSVCIGVCASSVCSLSSHWEGEADPERHNGKQSNEPLVMTEDRILNLRFHFF